MNENQTNSSANVTPENQPQGSSPSNPQVITPTNNPVPLQQNSQTPTIPQQVSSPLNPQPVYGNSQVGTGGSSPVKSKGKIKIVFVIVFLVLIFIIAAVFAFNAIPKDGEDNKATTALSCSITTGTVTDRTTLITAYTQFAGAVSSKNQACADTLTSDYFKKNAKQSFAAPDGKWITAQPAGLRPISEDFSQLPKQYTDTSFTQSEYMQSIVYTGTEDVNEPPSVTGTTLGYPVDLSKLTGDTGSKWQIAVSFVQEGEKILVDEFKVKPVDGFSSE